MTITHQDDVPSLRTLFVGQAASSATFVVDCDAEGRVAIRIIGTGLARKIAQEIMDVINARQAGFEGVHYEKKKVENVC